MVRQAIGGAIVLALAPLAAHAQPAPIEDGALIVREVPRPASPPPQPAATPAPVLRAEAPGSFTFGWMQAVPAGEIVLQQGGFNHAFGRADALGVGTGAVGLAMRGVQDGMKWSHKASVDRQNAQWLLGEFNLTGEFPDRTHFAVGDEQVLAGPLLLEPFSLRGVHAALSPGGVDARLFFGEDRPMLNHAALPRTTAGLETAWQLAGVPVRARGVLHEAAEQQRWSGAASLGSAVEVLGARLDGELAASSAGGPGDTAWTLDAQVPIGPSALSATYMHLGPHFRRVRHLAMPEEGGRESWQASWAMPLGSAWRAHAQLLDLQSNTGGQPELPRQAQRMAMAGVMWLPEQGPSGSLSYARTQFRSEAPARAYEAGSQRLSAELRLRLPASTPSRLHWDWWQHEPVGGIAASAHQIGLQSGRLFDTPLSFSEALTVSASSPTRLAHGLGWQLSWPKQRFHADTRAFYDHPLGAVADPSSQVGLALGLTASIAPTDSLSLTGQVDRRLDGRFGSTRWSLHYTTRFGGGASRPSPAAPAARLAGRVLLAPGTAPLPADALTVVLDRVQRVALDAEGRFAFEHLAPGAHTLELDAARLPLAYAIPRAHMLRRVTISAEQALTDLNFVVGPAHRVTGRVALPSGRGAGFVGVALEGAEPMETWTDDEGRFAFEGVPAGPVRVHLTTAPPGSGYSWDTEAVELELTGGQAPPALAFTVHERQRPIHRVTLPGGLDGLDLAPASVRPGAGARKAPAPRPARR